MKPSQLLNDPRMLKLLSEVLEPAEYNDLMARLVHGGDTVFCAAAVSLSIELTFSAGEDRSYPVPNRMELLLNASVLIRMSQAMATDHSSEVELNALAAQNAFAIRRLFERADGYLTEIAMRLSSGSDALFCKLMSIFAAAMLYNLDHLDDLWKKALQEAEAPDAAPLPDDPKNKPN